MSIKIIGTGKGIPKKILTNEEISTFLDTNDEWIRSRTGIERRFICSGETLTDISALAAEEALSNSGLKIKEIDLIICSTISGDYTTPSQACLLAERLNAKCPAFDINAACCGAIYAMDVASKYIQTGGAKHILIVCAEMMSKHADWKDRSTCVLFGDGAGACVVTKGNALKYINISCSPDSSILNLKSADGNNPYANNSKEKNFLQMQGQEVFKFAVLAVIKEIKRAMKKLNLLPEKIDYFLLHQANKRIIDSAREKLKQDTSKFPMNIHKYGNMSSASLLILLNEMLSNGKIKKNSTLLLSVFGAGMTTGTCIIVWE